VMRSRRLVGSRPVLLHTGCPMPQLSVTPADLAGAASVLRRIADGLDDAVRAFSAVADRCALELGGAAATRAIAVAGDARRAAGVVASDVETAGRGLVLVATAYADLDAHLIGGRR